MVLPELWSTAYDLEHGFDHASPLALRSGADGWFGRFAQLAQEHRVWLCGSMLEERDGQLYNCLALYSPQGELAGVYRKIHLFRLMNEHQYLTPGEALTLLDLPWGKTGLAICYDLRFPELSAPMLWPAPSSWSSRRNGRTHGAPTGVPCCGHAPSKTRSSWRPAIGSARAKADAFFGASAVIDPWGEALIEGGETEALLTVRVDLSQVGAVRQRIPVFDDRRPELYLAPG